MTCFLPRQDNCLILMFLFQILHSDIILELKYSFMHVQMWRNNRNLHLFWRNVNRLVIVIVNTDLYKRDSAELLLFNFFIIQLDFNAADLKIGYFLTSTSSSRQYVSLLFAKGFVAGSEPRC